MQEAGFINKSLYTLGKVIAGLVRTSGDLSSKDVPYRDSKLTRLLIGSLGAGSKTLLVASITEGSSSLAETTRTLKFSMSAARLRIKPIRFLSDQEKLVESLRKQVRPFPLVAIHTLALALAHTPPLTIGTYLTS